MILVAHMVPTHTVTCGYGPNISGSRRGRLDLHQPILVNHVALVKLIPSLMLVKLAVTCDSNHLAVLLCVLLLINSH